MGVHGIPKDETPSEYCGAAIERPPGLKDSDPGRYGTLEHPGDGYSYDMFTQAAQLLGPDRRGDIDPLGALPVEHLVASGGSQSACRLATYFNAVHPLVSMFDAFLLTVYAGHGCVLDPATALARLPEIGDNSVVKLLPWSSHLIRDDLRTPVIVLNSEFEASEAQNQPDTDYLRWWEVAGTAHSGLFSPENLEDFLKFMPDACRVSFASTHRAALHRLHGWLNGEGLPPHQPRLLKQGNPPAIPRDEHGNAIGGIRWPDVEAPLGTHTGESSGDGFVQLMGKSTPFPAEKVRALYPSQETWIAKYQEATQRLVDSGVVLSDDAADMIARASALKLDL